MYDGLQGPRRGGVDEPIDDVAAVAQFFSQGVGGLGISLAAKQEAACGLDGTAQVRSGSILARVARAAERRITSRLYSRLWNSSRALWI